MQVKNILGVSLCAAMLLGGAGVSHGMKAPGSASFPGYKDTPAGRAARAKHQAMGYFEHDKALVEYGVKTLAQENGLATVLKTFGKVQKVRRAGSALALTHKEGQEFLRVDFGLKNKTVFIRHGEEVVPFSEKTFEVDAIRTFGPKTFGELTCDLELPKPNKVLQKQIAAAKKEFEAKEEEGSVKSEKSIKSSKSAAKKEIPASVKRLIDSQDAETASQASTDCGSTWSELLGFHKYEKAESVASGPVVESTHSTQEGEIGIANMTGAQAKALLYKIWAETQPILTPSVEKTLKRINTLSGERGHAMKEDGSITAVGIQENGSITAVGTQEDGSLTAGGAEEIKGKLFSDKSDVLEEVNQGGKAEATPAPAKKPAEKTALENSEALTPSQDSFAAKQKTVAKSLRSLGVKTAERAEKEASASNEEALNEISATASNGNAAGKAKERKATPRKSNGIRHKPTQKTRKATGKKPQDNKSRTTQQ